MQVRKVNLGALRASAQPRPLVTADVDKLAASIAQVGLIQPITVREVAMMQGPLAGSGYQIVAGHHRVAACRALGWTEVDAIVVTAASHLNAELLEIDENLCRSELTAAQRAQAIKRRKAIWEALHPAESGRNPPTLGGRGKTSFAADTGAVTGESKRRINEHLARAEALGDDLDKVTGTSLDKGVELDALAKLPEADRAKLIERAQAGEKVSARDAAPAAPTPKPVLAAPALTPSMRLQMALVHGINRMLESAGVETVEEFVAQIMALPVRERDFMADQLDVFEYVGCLGSNRRGE